MMEVKKKHTCHMHKLKDDDKIAINWTRKETS